MKNQCTYSSSTYRPVCVDIRNCIKPLPGIRVALELHPHTSEKVKYTWLIQNQEFSKTLKAVK
jgi:hypothetical protein